MKTTVAKIFNFKKILVATSSPHCLVSSSSPSQGAPPFGEGEGELQALKGKIYSVFHGIGNQEQGCCELVLGFQKAQGASL